MHIEALQPSEPVILTHPGGTCPTGHMLWCEGPSDWSARPSALKRHSSGAAARIGCGRCLLVMETSRSGSSSGVLHDMTVRSSKDGDFP